jgi:hypothetical protein
MIFNNNKGQRMKPRFTYDVLIVTGVTLEEKNKWKAKSEEKGYRTLSPYLVKLLSKFKDIGLEDATGGEVVPICGFNKTLDLKTPKRRSRAIRKFINREVKK